MNPFKYEFQNKLDKRCVGALIGLAVINLNNRDAQSIRDGIELLSKAYKYDSIQPLVLVHLANHFFFKNDMNKGENKGLSMNKPMNSINCIGFIYFTSHFQKCHQ